MKNGILFFAALLMAGLMTSCHKEDPVETAKKEQVAILEQYVNHTIAPTYQNLAAYSEQLVTDLQALRAERTQANVNHACETFLNARAWWEKSEAFLFGAASDFGIDPHIDSWPLDVDAFNTMMANTAQIQAMDAEDGDEYAGDKLGNSLLGFHGIEYILFSNGSPKSADEISDLQMIYAVAVAGDLRNRCFQLEVSWLGNQAPRAHRTKVEDLELNSTVNGGDYSYGTNLMKAGTLGSTYPSSISGLMAIVDGCRTIADEVGTSKIGKPYNGEDPNYIESPYSHKSIEDFYHNIISIENAYMGGVDGERNEDLSLHGYLKERNGELDVRVLSAIATAKASIQAMPAPFVQNYNHSANANAIEACQQLDEVLSEVNTWLETEN
ncbi:MAG: peptidase M75 [Bacteroidales bacterium]|nr:peptidase M75 [Bacteroidales bacterium]